LSAKEWHGLIRFGRSAFIRLDNGPEFVAKTVRDWIHAVGVNTAYIETGSSWENGYCESFNARFRDELLNGEVFYTLQEARSSSNNGGSTTTPSDHTAHWATALRLQNLSSRSIKGRSCTNIQTGPVNGGWSSRPLVGNVIYLFPSRHFTRLRRLPCTFLGGYDARTDFRVVHHA